MAPEANFEITIRGLEIHWRQRNASYFYTCQGQNYGHKIVAIWISQILACQS